MLVFPKIWRALFSGYLRFEIRHFAYYRRILIILFALSRIMLNNGLTYFEKLAV